MLPSENSNVDTLPGPDPADDINVFSDVVAAMKKLDREGRVRLLRTLATFFDISTTGRTVDMSSTQSTQVPSASFSEDRSLSPKQFLLEKKPVTDIERIACLSYYLTHYRQTPHFKTLDLSKLNTDAAQIKFSNPAVAVDNAAQAGLLAQAGKGQKQISALGELYVQALPDRIAAKEAIAHGRKRKQRNRTKTSNKNAPKN